MNERTIRRKAKAVGYRLIKCRKPISIDNMGGYALVDLYTNAVVAGSRFELSLEDVLDYLAGD